MTLAQKLNLARQEAGYTHAALAEFLGISMSLEAAVMGGQKRVTVPFAVAVSKFLSVDPGEILREQADEDLEKYRRRKFNEQSTKSSVSAAA